MKAGIAATVVGMLLIAPGAAATTPGDHDTLSWRLRELSRPDLRSAGPGTQGEAVSLLAHGPGSLLRDGGALVVEVRVDRLRGRVGALRAAGARILHVSPTYRTISAAIDESDLDDVAAVPGVEFATEQIEPMTGSTEGGGAEGGTINTCSTGVVTEGDVQLKAAAARTQFDVDGTGVKVGMMSDSYNALGGEAGDVTTGDLPGAGNPCGRTTPVQVLQDFGGADEGRAMLQIVHDLAPGASLAFATALISQTSFADNIHALADNGANVIGDDIIFFREPMYQDGVIAKAVDDVTAQGIAYFSMAFNNNGLGFNSYEAPTGYRTTTCPAVVLADRAGGADSCMDFDPGVGSDNTLDVNVGASKPFRLSLSWAEPQFGITDDFDVYVLNGATISARGFEDNIASGSSTEFASFTTGGAGSRQIVIRRYSGSGTPRLKWVSGDNGANTITSFGQAVTAPDVSGPTIFGHNGAEAAQTVGAVPFNNSSIVEPFSSRGPVTYLFAPVSGTTPSPPLGAPQTITKPNISATDGGLNTFFGGGNRFFGTSAAAPHAAAVGALQLEANPALTNLQVEAAQRNTAVPVGALGANVVGSGLIDAQAAIASVPPTSPLDVTVTGPPPSNDATPTLTISGNRHLKTLACSIDGGAATPCSSPFTTPALTDGQHTLAVNATDYFANAGNGSASFTIDTTAALKIAKGPKKKSTKAKAKFKIDAEAGATLTCKLDKAAAKPCAADPKFKVKPGKHKLTVTATDAVGNVSSDTYKWKVKKKS